MPGTTSTALPSFAHDQHHETDAAKWKGGVAERNEWHVKEHWMTIVISITARNCTHISVRLHNNALSVAVCYFQLSLNRPIFPKWVPINTLKVILEDLWLSDFQHVSVELVALNSSDQCLSVFKSRLKTFLFTQAFTEHISDLPPAPLKLRPYGAIEIRLSLLF